MRSLFVFFLMSCALLSWESHQISPDFFPSDSFEVALTAGSPDIILHNEKFVLILSGCEFQLTELKKTLLLLGYDYETLYFRDSSFKEIKASIDSVFCTSSVPMLILIVGDENIIPPYRERINPYTKNRYSTDYDYGLIDGGPAFVSVSRIPAASNESLERYICNLMRHLISNSSSNVGFLSPFYDFDSDSVEDYLYSSLSYYASNVIGGSILHMETNSPYPKYFFDLRELDDTFKLPAYDWDVGVSDITSGSPLLLAYRGHGNPVSTVLPDLSLSQISLASLSEGGAFISFTCLLSAFDSYTSGFGSCFAESILFTEEGFSFCLGFSSETFYQYNNFMFNLFFDHYNDAVYAPLNSDTGANLLDACRDCSSKLFSVFGFNEYSECQTTSMQMLGIPLLSLKKNLSSKPFIVQDTLLSDDTLIYVTLLKDAPFFLSTENSIYDSLPYLAGGYNIRASNINAGSVLYASSYYNGILFVDTIHILQGGISCIGASLSDSSGDNDGKIESGERVTFSFLLDPIQDSCTLSSENPLIQTILKPDNSGSYSHEFTIPKDCEEIHLAICAGGSSFFWSFETLKYKVFLLKVKSMDSPFVFSGSTSQMMFEFFHTSLSSTPCTLSFIENDSYNCSFESFVISADCDTAVFFNEVSFFSDSFDFMIEYRCNLFTDTLFVPFICSKRNSIFIYDPKNQYAGSDFLSFLNDSLQCEAVISDSLNDSIFFPANIFAFGIYPNNDELDSIEASYIRESALLGSSILLDGGDALGYDKAGKSLLGLFGISSASDGSTVYAGSIFDMNLFDFTLTADTTIKFIDSYISSSPFLYCGQTALGSFSENRIAQSYPLTKLSFCDENWLFYLYASVLLDYQSDVIYEQSVNVTYKKSSAVLNKSDNPVMIKILKTPSFFDSLKLKTSRVILPDSQDNLLFFIKKDAPSFSADIIFTTGFDTMCITASYTANASPKIISAVVTSFGFSFKIEENGFLILPPKADKTCFVKKEGCIYTIYGDISKLECESVVFRAETQDIIVKFPKIKAKDALKQVYKIYNLLGEETSNMPSGVYFSNEKKFVNIK